MDQPLMKHAQWLVDLVRKEKYIEAYETYFSKDAQWVENFPFEENDVVTTWRDSLIAKAKKREETQSATSLEVSDPSVFNGNQCIVWMKIITKNEDGSTQEDEEYVLYTRENQKVIEERFFYIMPEFKWTQYDEFAKRFFEALQSPDYKSIYKNYFNQDARNIEAYTPDGSDTVTSGLETIIAKAEQWDDMYETTSWWSKNLSLANENQFIVAMWVETVHRETWEKMDMNEYALYTLKGDKISEEKFFYRA